MAKKNNIKKPDATITVPNKYDFAIIKLPNGDETLCKSTYTSKINETDNISVTDTNKIKYINVDVDYTQYTIHNHNKVKKNIINKKQSARTNSLSKKFI